MLLEMPWLCKYFKKRGAKILLFFGFQRFNFVQFNLYVSSRGFSLFMYMVLVYAETCAVSAAFCTL